MPDEQLAALGPGLTVSLTRRVISSAFLCLSNSFFSFSLFFNKDHNLSLEITATLKRDDVHVSGVVPDMK